MRPKKKHLDYLAECTYQLNVSMQQLTTLLLERMNHSNWTVAYKALITVHYLMSYGSEKFTQNLVASNNHSFQVNVDRLDAKGSGMSLFIKRYSNYINQKTQSFKTLTLDLCRTTKPTTPTASSQDENSNHSHYSLRTMPIERLLETLPVIQRQLEALLDFGCTAEELNNSIITASFTLLFHDAIRLFAGYNDGIINLSEKYFDLNKKMCREAFEAYKKFLACSDRLANFLKVAEAINLNNGDLPDFKRAPSSLLDAFEKHLISLENNKKRDTKVEVDTKLAAFPSFSVNHNDLEPPSSSSACSTTSSQRSPTLGDIFREFESQLSFATGEEDFVSKVATFPIVWLLEATHLPKQYKESRLSAYKLLCLMSIRRHDIELPQQYWISFYEALQRGLSSPDTSIHLSIIQNSTQLLSLELPGCTLLVHGLYERSRSLLLNCPSVASQKIMPISISARQQQQHQDTNLTDAIPRDQAVQILSSILSLSQPIKKLMVLKLEPAINSLNLIAPGDIKAKVMETLLACNTRPVVLDSRTRSKSLCSLALQVYNDLCDASDGLEVEKLFDTIMTDLQDASNKISFRINCDLLRLFADHAVPLTSTRPALVSSLVQTVCQLIVRLSVDANQKESIRGLLICLEDWCMAVSKGYLVRPIDQLSISEDDDTLSTRINDDSLWTIVLRSLESVIHDEQYLDCASNRCTLGSTNTSKNSDSQSSSGRMSQTKSRTSSVGSHRDRTLTNNDHSKHNNSGNSPSQTSPSTGQAPISLGDSKKDLDAIKLACKVSHLKLLTYMGHFPFGMLGPASMSCCVNELDYLSANENEQPDAKNTTGALLLVIDNELIVSFIGAPRNAADGLCQPVHMIVRNLCGKYLWDATCLSVETLKPTTPTDSNNQKSSPSATIFDQDSYQDAASRSSNKYDSDYNDGDSSSSFSSRASSSRDCLGDLMNHLSCSLSSYSGNNHSSISSSSCQQMGRLKRNSAQSICNPKLRVAQAEETMIALLTNQRFQELNHCEKSDDSDRSNLHSKLAVSKAASFGGMAGAGGDTLTTSQSASNTSSSGLQAVTQSVNRVVSFEQCRQLMQQLGCLSWEKRCKVDSLTRSSRLMRELKNLDNQPSRETHKIAVIYVGQGQEDKNSILANSIASKPFEEFVAGLGWDVDLSTHAGFKGGLQANKSTGETAPYYCNGTTEVMFHVSTRIPVNSPVDDESLNRKLRHLGNDEIHIVWSEHARDYRRGIIPTEFGDVIIAIYPMQTFQGYYRVQISSKPEVPPFGPLFDNCIVHQTSLAPLVRATAINASRANRLILPYFQPHYEERNRLIETIVTNHKGKLSFEEFAMQLYATNELRTSGQSQPTTTTATTIRDKCCA